MSTLVLPNIADAPAGGASPLPRQIELQVDPDGTMRIPGMLTRDEWLAAERVRMSQFYLVRNDGPETGGPAPCKRSKSDFDRGHIHRYFTYMCKERPFRGLEAALHAWAQAANVDTRRRSTILDGMADGLQDYADANPETSRLIRPATPNTAIWYAAVAGVTVPLKDATEAMRYIDRINDRRPEVRLTLALV